jgi:predicted esterase
VKKWPVLMVLHGSSGFADAEVERLSAFADEHGLILLGVQDELQQAAGGWAFNDYAHATHVQALTWLKRRYAVDDTRVFILGGSRGGHGTWDLATSHPDLFAGAIPIVGGPINLTFRFLPNLKHVSILDLQGGQDQPGLLTNLKSAFEILEGLHYDATLKIDAEAGHYYPVDWDEIWKWMETRRRPSYPKEIVRVAVRDDRSRADWIEMRDLPQKKFERPPPTKIPQDRTVDRDEAVKLIRKNYERHSARVEAKVVGNLIDLTVVRAPKVVVYLSDHLVDLEKKVTIKVNGRIRTAEVFPRSLETMLSRVKATADREQLYPVRLEIRGSRR